MFMYFLFISGINKSCNIAEMCLVCQNPVKRSPLHLEEDLALLRVEGEIDIRYSRYHVTQIYICVDIMSHRFMCRYIKKYSVNEFFKV